MILEIFKVGLDIARTGLADRTPFGPVTCAAEDQQTSDFQSYVSASAEVADVPRGLLDGASAPVIDEVADPEPARPEAGSGTDLPEFGTVLPVQPRALPISHTNVVLPGETPAEYPRRPEQPDALPAAAVASPSAIAAPVSKLLPAGPQAVAPEGPSEPSAARTETSGTAPIRPLPAVPPIEADSSAPPARVALPIGQSVPETPVAAAPLPPVKADTERSSPRASSAPPAVDPATDKALVPKTPQTPAAPVASVQVESLPVPQAVVATAAGPAPTATAPAPPTPNTGVQPPVQLESLIDSLMEARDIGRQHRSEFVLRHSEFGAVTVRFERTDGDVLARLQSRDPGFAPAAQAALAERMPVAGAVTETASSGGRGHESSSSQSTRDNAQTLSQERHDPARDQRQDRPRAPLAQDAQSARRRPDDRSSKHSGILA